MSCFVFLLSRSARKHRLGEGRFMSFRRADTLGNECLDFFFGRQLDVVFLHKQIRIQATCCILDDCFSVVRTQKQTYRQIVIGRIIAFSDSAVAVRRIASGSAI